MIWNNEIFVCYEKDIVLERIKKEIMSNWVKAKFYMKNMFFVSSSLMVVIGSYIIASKCYDFEFVDRL